MKLYPLLLLVVFIVCITACSKTNNVNRPQTQQAPVKFDSILQCHQQTNTDSISIRNALISKWQWQYIDCYWKPETANGDDFKNLTIEFKQNDTVEVTSSDQTIQKSHWLLSRTNDGYFRLITTPLVIQLPGKVLRCGSWVIFYDSYVDGCNNYFKKQ
jgi:hypothetical protein